jgi:hypothetical protein
MGVDGLRPSVSVMDGQIIPSQLQPIHYDAVRRRLWLFGQRCHHGATGSVLALTALGALATHRLTPWPSATLAATGTLLMAHDWKDHALWFQPGRQSER